MKGKFTSDRSTSLHFLLTLAENEHHTDDEYSSSDIFETVGELKSLILLSLGPFVAQLSQGFYGLVNTIWVARALGNDGVAAIGASAVVEFVPFAVSAFLSTCMSAQVSYLFGKGSKGECTQLYIDFLRIAIIIGLILPIILLPIAQPLIKWFGASHDIARMGFEYMIPLSAGSSFTFVFFMNCGLLQAEGHTFLYAFAQMGAFALYMLLNPLFLLYFKLPIWGTSLASVISNSIPGVVLTILVFRGKFELKPKLNMIIKGFTHETLEGIKSGISTLFEEISLNLPLILMQKYISISANAVGEYTSVMAVWSIIADIEELCTCLCSAVMIGLLPAASYSYGAKNYSRILKLMLHALWMMTIWSTIFSLILIFLPGQVASIWSNDPEFIKWAKKMIHVYALANSLNSADFVFPTVLIAMKRVTAATVLSFLTCLLPIPIFATILYFTNKNDPVRIMYTFPLDDVFSIIVSLFFMIKPILILKGKIKDCHQFIDSSSTSSSYSDYSEDARPITEEV